MKPWKLTITARERAIGDVKFVPFEQDHGSCISTGYRFDDVAYSTDFFHLDDKAIETLKGVKIWIADAAGYRESPETVSRIKVHASLETLYALNKRIGAEKVYLTSLSLAMDYKTLLTELPNGFEPAWDGMRINLS